MPSWQLFILCMICSPFYLMSPDSIMDDLNHVKSECLSFKEACIYIFTEDIES